MLNSIFKKKTRQEHVDKLTESVFSVLVRNTDFEFTDLEKVQALNNVRRKLSEHFESKRSAFMEDSVTASQNAEELKRVINYIE